jgi:hypothetical protein
MALPLPQYIKAKDNYCIAYYGNNKEHLIQLKLLRPIMERTFPGIKVFLACREDSSYLLKGQDRILTREELKDNKHMFAYIRELVCDMQSHPVEEFMKESDIPCGPILEKQQAWGTNCVLLASGVPPVRSLTANQIRLAILHIKKFNGGAEPEIYGTNPEFDRGIDGHSWAVGVESEQLYEAAARGMQVTLIPTGFGENLFKKMFPSGQILSLPA